MNNPTLWFAVAVCIAAGKSVSLNKNRGCTSIPKYQSLVALVDLRSGPHCRYVNLYGVQQIAVIQTAVDQINAEFLNDNVTIKLQVFDTCSTVEGTRMATLKSLVAAQQTCHEAPFLLGFVGPELNVNSVRPITNVFNAAHVVPYPPEGGSLKKIEGVFPVSSYPIRHHTQAVKAIIKEMGLKKIAILYEENAHTSSKLADITDSLHDDVVCITAIIAVHELDKFSFKELMNNETSDGLLILVEGPSLIDTIVAAVSRENDLLPKNILFSIAKVGSIAWPRKPAQNVFIIQMLGMSIVDDLARNMDSSLLHEWIHQKVIECSGGNETLTARCTSIYSSDVANRQQDWTLAAMQYGIHLYASAVRIARAACSSSASVSHSNPCMNPSKWLKTLNEASLFVRSANDSSLSERVSFRMDVPCKFVVSHVQTNGHYLEVGVVESGVLKLKADFRFPEQSTIFNDSFTECSVTVAVKSKPNVKESSSTSFEEDILEFFKNMETAEGYQMIGVLAGGCTGVILMLLMMFYVVYRGVNPKSSGRSSPCSADSTITGAS